MHNHLHGTIIHNSQEMKATQCSPTDEWIKKTWFIHTMESDSALKRKEIWFMDYSVDDSSGHYAK